MNVRGSGCMWAGGVRCVWAYDMSFSVSVDVAGCKQLVTMVSGPMGLWASRM